MFQQYDQLDIGQHLRVNILHKVIVMAAVILAIEITLAYYNNQNGQISWLATDFCKGLTYGAHALTLSIDCLGQPTL